MQMRALSILLMLVGTVLLLYAGTRYLQVEYYRRAARGDSPLPLPAHLAATPLHTRTQQRQGSAVSPPHKMDAEEVGLVGLVVALLEQGQAAAHFSHSAPSPAPPSHVSTVSRIVIPAIALDSKVTAVGWVIEEERAVGEAAQPVWEVARYMAGHHRGSANPGEGGNVVLSGHVGGYGRVFGDLFYLRPGDEVVLYSRGKVYPYVVTERLILEEENEPPEQRAANARYIQPTHNEVVTLVTCWPPSGANKFTQRVIIRAQPARSPASSEVPPGLQGAHQTGR